jgi:hypothetical protein
VTSGKFLLICGAVFIFSQMVRADELSYSLNLPSDWKKFDSVDGVDTWKRRGTTDEIITIVTHQVSKPFNLSKISVFDLIPYFEKIRNAALFPFGIKDWKILDIERAELAHHERDTFKIKGEYTGVNDQKTYFIEWQYYVGRKFYQITYSTERFRIPPEDAELLLGKFKPGVL